MKQESRSFRFSMKVRLKFCIYLRLRFQRCSFFFLFNKRLIVVQHNWEQIDKNILNKNEHLSVNAHLWVGEIFFFASLLFLFLQLTPYILQHVVEVIDVLRWRRSSFFTFMSCFFRKKCFIVTDFVFSICDLSFHSNF